LTSVKTFEHAAFLEARRATLSLVVAILLPFRILVLDSALVYAVIVIIVTLNGTLTLKGRILVGTSTDLVLEGRGILYRRLTKFRSQGAALIPRIDLEGVRSALFE
jgi:hypothetical protein